MKKKISMILTILLIACNSILVFASNNNIQTKNFDFNQNRAMGKIKNISSTEITISEMPRRDMNGMPPRMATNSNMRFGNPPQKDNNGQPPKMNGNNKPPEMNNNNNDSNGKKFTETTKTYKFSNTKFIKDENGNTGTYTDFKVDDFVEIEFSGETATTVKLAAMRNKK